jgi:hypothetical protein
MHGGQEISDGIPVGALAVATVLMGKQGWLGQAEATTLQPPLGLTSAQPRAAVEGHRRRARVGAKSSAPGNR